MRAQPVELDATFPDAATAVDEASLAEEAHVEVTLALAALRYAGIDPAPLSSAEAEAAVQRAWEQDTAAVSPERLYAINALARTTTPPPTPAAGPRPTWRSDSAPTSPATSDSNPDTPRRTGAA